MTIHGDSLEKLKEIADDSVDLLCTDPPYGYSFMGKAWDKALPDIGIFKECLRVLKPGAFAFVMSAPRSDVCSRMAILLEDAGFTISFTPIYWTYASGFPKAMNIGKMVDKREGVEVKEGTGFKTAGEYGGRELVDPTPQGAARDAMRHTVQSEAGKALDGSYGGFQPKPAVEVVIVAMKPLSEKTYVDQALKNGKGITWLDDVRIPLNGEKTQPFAYKDTPKVYGKYAERDEQREQDVRGRFPANLLVSDDVLNEHSRFFSLDEWANTLPFLAVPKASKREKNEGTEHLPVRQTTGGGGMNDPHLGSAYGSIKAAGSNHHPTVKPLKLMSYLITLGSRPGDVVLDPFLGSGTTAIAAKQLGREYIGIEREEEYLEIAEARLAAIIPTLI